MSILVSIIIPTYNPGQELIKLWSVLQKQTLSDWELIVVDSGSNDGTIDFLKNNKVKYQSINRDQFNHGATRNLGAEMALGKYLVFLTQDALPINENWLKNLVRNFEDNLVVGVFARQLPCKQHPSLIKYELAHWQTGQAKRLEKVTNQEDWSHLSPQQKYHLAVYDDICSAMPKEVWQNHPYPETNYGEDVIWAKNMLLTGKKIVFEPEAIVYHSHWRSPVYELKRNYLSTNLSAQEFGYIPVKSAWEAVYFSAINIIKLYGKYFLSFDENDNIKANLIYLLLLPCYSLARTWGWYLGYLQSQNKLSAKWSNWLRQGV